MCSLNAIIVVLNQFFEVIKIIRNESGRVTIPLQVVLLCFNG